MQSRWRDVCGGGLEMPSSGANRAYAGYVVQDASCGQRRIGAFLTGRNNVYVPMRLCAGWEARFALSVDGELSR